MKGSLPKLLQPFAALQSLLLASSQGSSLRQGLSGISRARLVRSEPLWRELCWTCAQCLYVHPECWRDVAVLEGAGKPSFGPRVESIRQMAFGLPPGRKRERRSRESTSWGFFARQLQPVPRWPLPLPLRYKQPNSKSTFNLILLFASVLELLVVDGAYPPAAPCPPFGCHQPSCAAFLCP